MRYLILLTMLALAGQLQAQDAKKARLLFDSENYGDALEEFSQLVEEEPENAEYHYLLGICYLNTYIDKSLAVSHLEFVTKQSEYDPNAMYLLGRAYHFAYMFDEAIEAYGKFRDKGEGSEFNLSDVSHQMEHCEYAKELFRFPVDVTFRNLGDQINSPYPDYYPFVPSDESFIIFNTRRDDGSEVNPNGKFSGNIYSASARDGKFGAAAEAGEHINSENLTEEIIGLTADGHKALLFIDDIKGYGDIFMADVVGGKLDKPVKLDKAINSRYVEIAASLSADGNKIYFASNRPGGYGGVDIYKSQKLPNGKWGPAVNLGPSVNTKYDEDFPNISPDGKTLYFSSKGHTSMGGYDIFYATFDTDKQKFSGVRNLGYPVNTPEDNMNFRVSENGRYGYISALREEGYGDLDIYEITFNQVEPKYTVLIGELKSSDEAKELFDPFISVVDLDTGEEFGTYSPNQRTNRYVIILPPGRYNMLIDTPGFEEHSEDIEVFNKNAYKAEIHRDITLKAN